MDAIRYLHKHAKTRSYIYRLYPALKLARGVNIKPTPDGDKTDLYSLKRCSSRDRIPIILGAQFNRS
jgi:hypothetical protein